MALKKKIENRLIDFLNDGLNLKTGVAIAVGFIAFLGLCAYGLSSSKNDITAGSVMVTTLSGNSGGSGVILTSDDTESKVLTNSHVCHVIENGGIVTGSAGTFIISSYKRSENHDLCLITVNANLHYNTKVASRPGIPYYEHASISGHPALMPNVITTGLFSGRKIIQVMMGFRQCTQDDMKNPNTAILCMLAGGIPEIKSYDSVLVSATIMPGSSGSGVYNENMELTGLAFAGSGDLGFAWTVPYEDLYNFIYSEEKTLHEQKPSTLMDLSGPSGEGKTSFDENAVIKKFQQICSSPDRDKAKNVCELITEDMVYRR